MSEAQLRQIAARLGGRVELLDVRLMSSAAETVELVFADTPLSVSLEVEPSALSADSGRALIVTARFEITVAREPDGTPDGEVGDASADDDSVGDSPAVATLSCTYSALYDLGEEREISEDELDAFARTTGVFALYPYARAWAQDTTARMGLPPLTLQVYRIPVDAEVDDA